MPNFSDQENSGIAKGSVDKGKEDFKGVHAQPDFEADGDIEPQTQVKIDYRENCRVDELRSYCRGIISEPKVLAFGQLFKKMKQADIGKLGNEVGGHRS